MNQMIIVSSMWLGTAIIGALTVGMSLALIYNILFRGGYQRYVDLEAQAQRKRAGLPARPVHRDPPVVVTARQIRVFYWKSMRPLLGKASLPYPLLFALSVITLLGQIGVIVLFIEALRAARWTSLGPLLVSMPVFVGVAVMFVQARFGSRRSWFYLAESEKAEKALSDGVAELLRKIRAGIDSGSGVRSVLANHVFGVDHRVAGEALLKLIDDEDNRVAEGTYKFLRSLEADRGLRRVASPLLSYVSEKTDARLGPNWLDGYTKDPGTQQEWQQIDREKRFVIKLQRYLLDIPISFAAILLLGPAAFFLSVLATLASGRRAPTIFVTPRTGRRGVIFSYFRINAMAVDPKSGFKYITFIGRFLLWTGLDRLPTFVNILTGSMSLIGPHTLYMCQLDRLRRDLRKHRAAQYPTDDLAMRYIMKRMAVNPGVAGAAQIVALTAGRKQCIDYLDLDVASVNQLAFWRNATMVLESVFFVLWALFSSLFVLPLPGLAPFLLSPQAALRNRRKISDVLSSQIPQPARSTQYRAATRSITTVPAYAAIWAGGNASGSPS